MYQLYYLGPLDLAWCNLLCIKSARFFCFNTNTKIASKLSTEHINAENQKATKVADKMGVSYTGLSPAEVDLQTLIEGMQRQQTSGGSAFHSYMK